MSRRESTYVLMSLNGESRKSKRDEKERMDLKRVADED
jgi:hypothetical protein